MIDKGHVTVNISGKDFGFDEEVMLNAIEMLKDKEIKDKERIRVFELKQRERLLERARLKLMGGLLKEYNVK